MGESRGGYPFGMLNEAERSGTSEGSITCYPLIGTGSDGLGFELPERCITGTFNASTGKAKKTSKERPVDIKGNPLHLLHTDHHIYTKREDENG